MKIYEMKIAPNPRRVRIFLAEKGISEVEFVEMDLKNGENLTPEFRQKSPLGKVPVLELDDGRCICETVAICRYFEEIQPAPSLMGTTPFDKASIEMWQRWMELYFLLPTGMSFQHSTGYFADRMNPIPEWGEECRSQVLKFLDFMDDHLKDQDYIAGNKFSIADITALCALDFNRVNKIGIAPKQKNLKKWYERVCARASINA